MKQSERQVQIELPWPDSILAGHNKNTWWKRLSAVKSHRAIARAEALKSMLSPRDGDIAIHVDFCPPNRRGDRVNYPIMVKPYFDGLAEGWGINDKRFLPSYGFCETVEGGKVVVTL